METGRSARFSSATGMFAATSIPAVALPVWPGLEFLLFKVTGVSLVAARALSVSVFGGILVASYLLLRRLGKGTSLAAATAVALLAVSPFCFAFTRLAILEPLLVLLTLLAILATAGARSRPVFSVLALGTASAADDSHQDNSRVSAAVGGVDALGVGWLSVQAISARWSSCGGACRSFMVDVFLPAGAAAISGRLSLSLQRETPTQA